MRWRPTRDEQVGQGRQNILMLELPCNDERQAFLSTGTEDSAKVGI